MENGPSEQLTKSRETALALLCIRERCENLLWILINFAANTVDNLIHRQASWLKRTPAGFPEFLEHFDADSWVGLLSHALGATNSIRSINKNTASVLWEIHRALRRSFISRFVGLFLPNMNSSLIDVNTAYDIEKVICYRNSSIFDNLRASWLSDLVFVWVQHLYATSMRNFHWNIQNAIIWTILGLCDSKSLRLDPEAKFCISFDLGLSQQISADFVELFSRDCLCTTVFTIV